MGRSRRGNALAIPEVGEDLASCRRASDAEEREILAREIDKRRSTARWIFTAAIALMPVYVLIIQALFQQTHEPILALGRHPVNELLLWTLGIAAMLWLMTVSWILVGDVVIADGPRHVVYDNTILRKNYWESTLYLRFCTMPLFFSPLIAALVYVLLVYPVTWTNPLLVDVLLFAVYLVAYQRLQTQWQRFLGWARTAVPRFFSDKNNAA